VGRHLNTQGFEFSQAKPVSPQFYLKWITERRSAAQGDIGAWGQPHLKQSKPNLVLAIDPQHPRRSADRKIGKRAHVHCSGRTRT